MAFLVGEPKFQDEFAQDNLAAGVTNVLLQCRLYVLQRSGSGYFLSFYISEYGDVRAIIGIHFSLILYDKVCFTTSNYMKIHYFHSFHYLNSPQNSQCRH